AAVVATARIALGVLVAQRRPRRRHDGRGRLVLAGDQLDARALPVELADQDLRDLRVLLEELGVARSVVGVGLDLGAHDRHCSESPGAAAPGATVRRSAGRTPTPLGRSSRTTSGSSTIARSRGGSSAGPSSAWMLTSSCSAAAGGASCRTVVPSTSRRRADGIAPCRRTTGSSPVQSTIVEAAAPARGPPSR